MPQHLALDKGFDYQEVRDAVAARHYIAGLDHGIGHLACMSPQKNERLTFSKG
jgi:hypothetical protein